METVPSDQATPAPALPAAPDLSETTTQGLTLFFIVIYAPFSIAALLSDRFPSFPLSYFVAIILFSMAIGTLVSAYFTRTSLVVAPAVGMASFISSISVTTISTSDLLIATLLASAIAFALSRPRENGRPSLRKEFLDGIPRPIIVGVRGGVGALLAAAAVEGLTEVYRDHREQYPLIMAAFVAGVGALLYAEMKRDMFQSLLAKEKRRDWKWGFRLASSANVLVPLAILFVLGLSVHIEWPAFQAPTLPDSFFPIIGSLPGREQIVSRGMIMACFAAVILFIFITDIPGSPYDFFRAPGRNDKDTDDRIECSFRVTSATSAANALFGLFTAVYYAENHIFTNKGSNALAPSPKAGAASFLNSGAIAVVCSILLFLCGVMFLFMNLPVKEMKLWLLIVVSPSLFCLGIHLTARAMQRDLEEEWEDVKAGHKPPDLVSFFLPVSLTLLLTHFVGFELALPLGIIFYGIASSSSRQSPPRADAADFRFWFWFLFWVSVAIALCIGGVKITGIRLGAS